VPGACPPLREAEFFLHPARRERGHDLLDAGLLPRGWRQLSDAPQDRDLVLVGEIRTSQRLDLLLDLETDARLENVGFEPVLEQIDPPLAVEPRVRRSTPVAELRRRVRAAYVLGMASDRNLARLAPGDDEGTAFRAVRTFTADVAARDGGARAEPDPRATRVTPPANRGGGTASPRPGRYSGVAAAATCARISSASRSSPVRRSDASGRVPSRPRFVERRAERKRGRKR
jgi:hypothetical protein